MLLFIVRHGDPIYRPDSLTPKGHLQAQALAKRFAVNGLDRIYSSPLIRAQMTAQPTCDILGMKYEIEEWTNEELAHRDLSYFDEQGARRWLFAQQNTNLKNDETVNLTNENWFEAKCFEEGKERYVKGYQRICDESDKFIEKLGYKRNGAVYDILNPSEERVAVFCHAGFGVSWISHLLNIPPHIFWTSFSLAPSGVTVILFKNNKNGITNPVCLCLSDMSHILREGLPYTYGESVKL